MQRHAVTLELEAQVNVKTAQDKRNNIGSADPAVLCCGRSDFRHLAYDMLFREVVQIVQVQEMYLCSC